VKNWRFVKKSASEKLAIRKKISWNGLIRLDFETVLAVFLSSLVAHIYCTQTRTHRKWRRNWHFGTKIRQRGKCRSLVTDLMGIEDERKTNRSREQYCFYHANTNRTQMASIAGCFENLGERKIAAILTKHTTSPQRNETPS
jgi:hypothetical protein